MSGLDELMLVLDWMFDHLPREHIPEPVANAFARLRQRQVEHRPFDDAQGGD